MERILFESQATGLKQRVQPSLRWHAAYPGPSNCVLCGPAHGNARAARQRPAAHSSAAQEPARPARERCNQCARVALSARSRCLVYTRGRWLGPRAQVRSNTPYTTIY
jgi:hypothetical protein